MFLNVLLICNANENPIEEIKEKLQEVHTVIMHPAQQAVTDYIVTQIKNSDAYERGLANPTDTIQWTWVKAHLAFYSLVGIPFCIEREKNTWANVSIKAEDWYKGSKNAFKIIKKERKKAKKKTMTP